MILIAGFFFFPSFFCDQGTRRRPPPFLLSIFFFLPSIASEPPSPPPPPRLCFSSPTPPLWLCLRFPSPPTTRPPSPFAPPPWPAAFSTHGFSSCRIHHPLPSSPSPPPATSPALSSSSVVDHCRPVPPWPDLWCCRRSLRSPSPPCFPPMPPVTAHFFCLRTLHSRKHSHGDEHDRDNNRDTSEEGGDEEDDEENTPDPEVHVYREFIAGQERKEPPGEATLGNINAGLQEDPTAPNCDAVAVIFIVVALLCHGDAFPPPSSSSPSPSASAP